MQLLIGYLVALAVFLGGGYAGVHWLLTPDDPPALTDKSASARLINAKKIRDARALHRKQAETLAEAGVKSAPAQNPPDPVVVAGGQDRSVTTPDQSDRRAPADAPQDAAATEVPAATMAANDPKLDARAEISPAVTPEKIKPVQNESQAPQKPVAKTDGQSVAARKPVEVKPAPASEPASHAETATNKKQAASKKKRAERYASSSRKPVMMILRTIEFPDGRREQRLLPMSEARAGLARYRSVSAFADDDDF